MTTGILHTTTQASSSYAALRHGGTPAALARAQLGLTAEVAFRLEKLFQARPGGGMDAMRPSFARHGEHVAAVQAAGGYPICGSRP